MGRLEPRTDPRWLQGSGLPLERDKRSNCSVACVMIQGRSEETVILTDFSRRGFRVAVRKPLIVGTGVQLKLPGCFPVEAVVRWSLAGSAGCAFLRPVQEELIAAAVAAASG